MTRERAKELLPVLQAFTEGKPFQYKSIDTGRWCDWDYNLNSDCPFFNDIEYRIKPECDVQKENHYRPFKDCDELIDYWYKKIDAETEYRIVKDDLQIPCIWVTNRDNGCREVILGFGESAVLLPRSVKDMNGLFEQYTFLDGSICGVEE